MLLKLLLFLLLLITLIYTFFLGLSVGCRHFKCTFNQPAEQSFPCSVSVASIPWLEGLFGHTWNGTGWVSQQIVLDVCWPVAQCSELCKALPARPPCCLWPIGCASNLRFSSQALVENHLTQTHKIKLQAHLQVIDESVFARSWEVQLSP